MSRRRYGNARRQGVVGWRRSSSRRGLWCAATLSNQCEYKHTRLPLTPSDETEGSQCVRRRTGAPLAATLLRAYATPFAWGAGGSVSGRAVAARLSAGGRLGQAQQVLPATAGVATTHLHTQHSAHMRARRARRFGMPCANGRAAHCTALHRSGAGRELPPCADFPHVTSWFLSPIPGR